MPEKNEICSQGNFIALSPKTNTQTADTFQAKNALFQVRC